MLEVWLSDVNKTKQHFRNNFSLLKLTAKHKSIFCLSSVKHYISVVGTKVTLPGCFISYIKCITYYIYILLD